MRTRLAWSNLTLNPRRTAAVVAGVGFSILLMFLQLGFYEACKLNATLIYDMFDFDAVLVSPYYLYLDQPGTVPLRRVYQARALEGVDAVVPVRLGKSRWRNPEKGEWHRIFAIGVDSSDRPFVSQGINNDLPLLSALDTILMDQNSTRKYGPRAKGTVTEFGGRQIRVVGEYSHGAGFISGGTLIMSDKTFCRTIGDAFMEAPTIGLIRFDRNRPREELIDRMRTQLSGDDVRIWSRSELEEKERYFTMQVKPLGMMFTSGAVIAFLVGAVIIYQILSTEVTHHRREYATLKAMGYTSRNLKRIVMEEGVILVLFGFVPAWLLSAYLYGLLRLSVKIPAYMTPGRVATVLVLSLLMTSISGIVAVRRVDSADPADLF
jgi:putative ABC transport system permease protein